MSMTENLDMVAQTFAPGQVPTGIVAMANARAFESVYYDEPLTNYTVGGWDRDPLQELLEFYAPAVPSPDRFTYKEADHADSFLQVANEEVIRAMGGRFGQLTPARMTEVHEVLDEKGLTIAVDRREIEENPLAEEAATDRIRRILLRTELKMAIELLIAASVNTGKVWNTDAGKDPDMDVSEELLDVENTVGLRPTRVGYGSIAWSKRQLAFRAQNNAGGYASASWSPSQLSDFLGINALAFTESRYRDAANSLATYIGGLVLMFHASSGLTRDDASNIKRFTGKVAGADMAVFRQEFPRTVEITVAHKSKTRITSTLGIRRFTIS